MFAVLDIETTGGRFNKEGITEIAIYKFDGHEIVDQFVSLINPEIAIQAFVVQLTGINNEMVKFAPKFFEIAKKIIEITKNCTIVAHNAGFDYRVLRTEFKRLGFDFESKTLCTIALSKKLLPQQPSYSLGKLVRTLGIDINDRHRASGDAMATLQLFKLLQSIDIEKKIVSDFIKNEIDKERIIVRLDPKLTTILENLPTKTGVYYLHDAKENIIYVGKSKNIKKRIYQHFTGTTTKCKKIQATVCKVTCIETGSELIAFLKESQEIKIIKPLYNRAQRKTIFEYSLYVEPDINGYLNLNLQKTDSKKNEITAFTSINEGKSALFKITLKHSLCQKLNGLYNTKNECFQYKLKECDGACIGLVPQDVYNQRVDNFIAKNNFENENAIIIDKGRNNREKSAVLIENGIYKGYTFYNFHRQVSTPLIMKKILIPMQNNKDVKKIIINFVRRNTHLKIINF